MWFLKVGNPARQNPRTLSQNAETPIKSRSKGYQTCSTPLQRANKTTNPGSAPGVDGLHHRQRVGLHIFDEQRHAETALSSIAGLPEAAQTPRTLDAGIAKAPATLLDLLKRFEEGVGRGDNDGLRLFPRCYTANLARIAHTTAREKKKQSAATHRNSYYDASVPALRNPKPLTSAEPTLRCRSRSYRRTMAFGSGSKAWSGLGLRRLRGWASGSKVWALGFRVCLRLGCC